MALKNNTKIDQIKSYLKKSNDYIYKNQMINFLKQNKNLPFNEDVLYDVLKIIIDNNLDFNTSINDAKKLYDTIVCDENNLEQYKMFLRIFPMHQQFDNNTAFKDANNFEIIYNMFENKKLLESIYKEVKDMNNTYYEYVSNTYYVYDYIIEARQYFVDEIAFYSSIMKFIISIKNNNIDLASEKEKFKEKQIENAKKMAGLYEINEQELEELPQKLENITTRQNELEIKLQKSHNLVDNFLSTLNKNMENYQIEKKEDLEQIKNYVMELESYANEIKQNKTNNKTTSNSKIDTLIEQLMIYNRQKENSNSEMKLEEITENKLKNDDNEQNKFKYYAIRKMLDKIKEDVNNELELTNSNKANIISDKFDNEMYQKIEKFIKIDYDKKIYNIASQDYSYCKYYYYALYNNTTYILGDLLNLLDINYISFNYLDNSIVSKFDEKIYLSLFPDRKKLLTLYESDLNLLNQILEINPKFDYPLKIEYVNKILEYFDIETFVNCITIFKEMSMTDNVSEILPIYREIYNKNPKFSLGTYRFLEIYDVLKNNNVFSEEELINLNKNQQCRINDLLLNSYGIEYNDEIIVKYENFIRKVILDESIECYLDYKVLLLFENKFTNPEKYVLYDRFSSSLMVKGYREIGDNIYNEHPIEAFLAKNKVKKIIKKENKKLKSK